MSKRDATELRYAGPLGEVRDAADAFHIAEAALAGCLVRRSAALRKAYANGSPVSLLMEVSGLNEHQVRRALSFADPKPTSSSEASLDASTPDTSVDREDERR